MKKLTKTLAAFAVISSALLGAGCNVAHDFDVGDLVEVKETGEIGRVCSQFLNHKSVEVMFERDWFNNTVCYVKGTYKEELLRHAD